MTHSAKCCYAMNVFRILKNLIFTFELKPSSHLEGARTFSIMTFCIMSFIVAFRINDTQHNYTQWRMLLAWVFLFCVSMRYKNLIVTFELKPSSHLEGTTAFSIMTFSIIATITLRINDTQHNDTQC